jgi:hypothetical protein
MLTKKKLASLAMAGVMTLSLAAPAFAASSESTTNRSLKVTAAYQAVTINVVVPTTGTVIINPYKLPVEIGKDADGAAIEAESKQIVSKPMAIKNQSSIKLDVNVSVTTAVTGNLKLKAADIEDNDTGNNAYVYAAFETTTLSGSKDDITDAAVAAAYKATTWTEPTDSTDNAFVLSASTTAVTKKGVATLVPATYDGGAFSAYAQGSIVFVGFDGSCVQDPKTAWTTKDGLTCTMAFTFTPNTTPDSGDGNT